MIKLIIIVAILLVGVKYSTEIKEFLISKEGNFQEFIKKIRKDIKDSL